MQRFQASVHFKVSVLPYMHYAEWVILLLQSFQHNRALLERHDSAGALVSMTLKLPALYHQECFKDHTIKWIRPCVQGQYWLQNVCTVCQCVSSVLIHPGGEPKSGLEKVSFTNAVCSFSFRDDVLSSVAWQDNVTRYFACQSMEFTWRGQGLLSNHACTVALASSATKSTRVSGSGTSYINMWTQSYTW